MEIPLIGFFLFSGRMTGLISEVSRAISGNGNVPLLLLDGGTLILTVVVFIRVMRDINPVVGVNTMKANHPCIKEVILPAHIEEAYTPQSELDARARQAYQQQVRNEEHAKAEELVRMGEQADSNPMFSAMMGFTPIPPTSAEPLHQQQQMQDELMQQFEREKERVENYDKAMRRAEAEARSREYNEAIRNNFNVGIDVEDLEDIDEIVRLHSQAQAAGAEDNVNEDDLT
jgi:hypothetical protein